VDGTEVIESEGAEAVVCADYLETPLVRVMSVVDFRDYWCRKGSEEERQVGRRLRVKWLVGL
jgi:hypothetical protein